MAARDSGGAPSIAVVIPCLDDGATLEEALASVVAQDEPCEVVVVDDGSSEPATLEVLERLERAGTRVLRQPNAGVAAARMAGVRATAAPYVMPLDADDRLVPGALTPLRQALDADDRVALAWGAYRRFGEADWVQRTAPTLDAWLISYQNDLPQSSLVRRSALVEAGGWQDDSAYEDWDLWMALAERGWRGVGIDAVTYEYRTRSGRRLRESAARHEEVYAGLRRRHPALFAQRRQLWRRSRAPLLLRAVLPLVELLPVSRERKRVLGGAATHLAYGRGVRLLLRRVRSGH